MPRVLPVLGLLGLLLVAMAACAPAAPPAPATGPGAAPTTGAQPTAASAAATAQPTTAPAPAAPKPATSLRIAILSTEGTLQPYTYDTGYPGWNLLHLVYDGLMQLDADNVPRPLLAREVKSNADGSQYDVTLRPNLRWHDGRPLTADDVKFTYEYLLANPHSRFTNPLRALDSITTTGADGVTIKLKGPNPSFPVRALADIPIMPKHLWESVPGPKTKEAPNLIGSGPYKLVEATPDVVYRMQANPDYFLGPPAVDELIFPVIKDLNTALQALRTGEVQVVTRELPPEQVSQFSQAPLKVAKGPGFAPTMLIFNAERAPFDRKEIRQAIDLAIDKQKLVDTLLLGNGVVATPGFVVPSSPYHDPSVQARFDLARAGQILDEIGARPGPDGVRVLDGKPLAFTAVVISNDPIRVRAGELVAGMLKDVGIQMAVSALERTAVISKVWPDFDITKGRDFDVTVFGWSPPVLIDPVRTVDVVHSDPTIGTINIGGFRSAEIDRLGGELRVTVDEERRKQLVGSTEKAIAEELPFVMLYFPDGAYAYRPQAYDNWVYQKGQGIISKLSFISGFGR